MSKISIKYKDMIFKNPFILASSPISRNAEMIIRAFQAGWGGAVTKTICLNPETIINVTPRLQAFRGKNGISGLNNIELISERPLDSWLDDIKVIKNSFPDRVLITSIMAEAYNISGWQKLAFLVQEAGADIIELNISCPHGMPERGMGGFCSEIPDICAHIVRAVKQATKIPVWTKLSPNITDISHLANACLDAGADGIVAINTVKGFSGIDIETLEPKLNINGYSSYGGFSGEFIKPIALKAVSDIAINNKCYISASGGISTWQDAVEFMLLGAGSIQVCTEVMFKGFSVIEKLNSGLEDYLERHNFSSIQDIIGISLNRIKRFEELNKQENCTAFIEPEKCIKCGKCYTSCRDGGYQAIDRDIHGSYKVNSDNCTGCGLCSIICPNSSVQLIKSANIAI